MNAAEMLRQRLAELAAAFVGGRLWMLDAERDTPVHLRGVVGLDHDRERARLAGFSLRAAFGADPGRAARFRLEAAGLMRGALENTVQSLWINGEKVEGQDAQALSVRNPFDDSVIAKVLPG